MDGQIELSAEIELPDGHRDRLWYRIPEELSDRVTVSADHFLVAAIFRSYESSRLTCAYTAQFRRY